MEKLREGTLVVVVGHGNAQKIIDFNYPYWSSLGRPLLGICPNDDPFILPSSEKIIKVGISCHHGKENMDRWKRIWSFLIALRYQSYLIMEYDTVNFTSRIPKIDEGKIYGSSYGKCLVVMSPWLLTYRSIISLSHSFCSLLYDECYTDSMIFEASQLANLKVEYLEGSFSEISYWNTRTFARIAAQSSITFVHGQKRVKWTQVIDKFYKDKSKIPIWY